MSSSTSGSSQSQLLNLQVCRNEKKVMARFVTSALRSTYQQVYNAWCCVCLYALGAFYMMIEVNRKLDWFSMVRKLDRSQDIPDDLSDLRCILTGGSRGIGWETAKLLHQRGAHIIVATSVKPGPGLQQLNQRLIHQLHDDHHESGQDHDCNPPDYHDDRLELWHLDLARFDSVIQFAERFRKSGRDLNILINNAGQMYAPFRVTVDGFESHWEVNYLSHSLLIALLLPILKSTSRKSGRMSRIVNVASSTHYCRNLNLDDVNGFHLYSPYHAYAQSKLAQIMFTYKLHQLLQSTDTGSHVTANCMHPGVAKTELYENVWWVKAFPFVADLLFRTAKEGSETVVFMAASPELEGISGKYFEDMRIVESSSFSKDRQHQDRLWDQTVKALRPAIEKYSSHLPSQDGDAFLREVWDLFSLPTE